MEPPLHGIGSLCYRPTPAPRFPFPTDRDGSHSASAAQSSSSARADSSTHRQQTRFEPEKPLDPNRPLKQRLKPFAPSLRTEELPYRVDRRPPGVKKPIAEITAQKKIPKPKPRFEEQHRVTMIHEPLVDGLVEPLCSMRTMSKL